MFRPSDKAFEQMTERCNNIIKGGDEELSKAWLIWANLYLQLADNLEAHAVIYSNELTPLIGALMHRREYEFHKLHEELKTSVVRALFQAKLSGRNELNFEDARKVIAQILGAD